MRIAPAALAGTVERLWAATQGLLVLVEPGTPAGYQRLLAVRDQLIAAGGVILAPCPHQQPCPLAAPDWCHFSQRLARSRDHRLAKGAETPFEDEKFSYLVVARPGVAAGVPTPRVLAPPRAGKPGIELKLCTPAGALENRFAARRDKAAYAVARRDRGVAVAVVGVLHRLIDVQRNHADRADTTRLGDDDAFGG